MDTMQFETVMRARVPRTDCPECGVKTCAVPWADLHGRFTLMFEAFAVRVLQAASSVEQASKLLGLNWKGLHRTFLWVELRRRFSLPQKKRILVR